MNRNRMEKYLKQVNDDDDEQLWDELAIDDQLVNDIRKTDEMSDGETAFQLTDWQLHLK